MAGVAINFITRHEEMRSILFVMILKLHAEVMNNFHLQRISYICECLFNAISPFKMTRLVYLQMK